MKSAENSHHYYDHDQQTKPTMFSRSLFFVWSRDDERFISSISVENIYEQTKTVI